MVPFSPFEWVLVSLDLLVGIVLIAIPRKREIGYPSLISFGIALILSALVFSAARFGLLKPTLLLYSFLYFLLLAMPASMLAFSIHSLAGKPRRFILAVAMAAMLPVLVQAFFFSRASQGFLFADLAGANFQIVDQRDVLGWLSVVYSRGLLVAALIVLACAIDFHLPASQNHGLIVILATGVVCVLVDMIRFSNLVPITDLAISLVSFGLIGAAFIYYRITFDARAVTRILDDDVLNHLEDGIIVLNGNDYITRMNSAAERIVGITPPGAYGRHIDLIFQNWNKIDLDRDSKNGLGFRASVNFRQEWRYLDVKIILLESKDPANGSKLLIVRDITNLKTDARQYARETMFVFLRSLVNAFKDSQTIQEFLEFALYQTLYTFSIENGFLFLAEASAKPEELNLSLAARHGSMDGKAILSAVYPSSTISTDINREALIISDVRKDKRVSAFFRDQPGDFSMAFYPLCVGQEVVGMMVLIRTHLNGFNPYDVMRLGAAADEIASFILKEREKQQQISYMERQRLVRDLHDSITQKLYGLLTITEAVKVGLEAGAVEKATALMPRVSENARQAVREMRLFLHQLDPVDLEREGFVSALHQRLLAVEGRADIKAHFKVTGKFSLPKEKEHTVYYIAEEALNNVLKHANAKTVQINLRRRNGRVYLDIMDDGCSFDPAEVGSGGRGLRNMKERAAQIGGTLKIVSGKQEGTKVSLSFPE